MISFETKFSVYHNYHYHLTSISFDFVCMVYFTVVVFTLFGGSCFQKRNSKFLGVFEQTILS